MQTRVRKEVHAPLPQTPTNCSHKSKREKEQDTENRREEQRRLSEAPVKMAGIETTHLPAKDHLGPPEAGGDKEGLLGSFSPEAGGDKEGSSLGATGS